MTGKRKRCMIDIEGTDLAVTAGVWQIGCWEMGGSYNTEFFLNPYNQPNRTVSTETIHWLEQHSPDWERGKRVFGILDPNVTILTKWGKEIAAQNFDEVWCKGSDYDFAILRSLFSAYGIRLPWHYTRQCCMRGFLQTYPEIQIDFGDESKTHGAFHDATIQGECMIKILKHMGRY